MYIRCLYVAIRELSALDMPLHELSAAEFQSVFVVADESH